MRLFIFINVLWHFHTGLKSQDLSCDTVENKKRINYGISIGLTFFPYAQPGFAPVKWNYYTNYEENGLNNLFYEQNYLLPVVEVVLSKKENFLHYLGGSYSSKKFYKSGNGRSDSVIYSGVYMFYHNQLLLRKYFNIPLIKNLYIGGRMFNTTKNMTNYYEYYIGVNQYGKWTFTDRNFLSSFGLSLGYKKVIKRFSIDFGINRTFFAFGIGEYFPNLPYSISKEEKERYYSFMLPFGNSLLKPLEKNLTPVTLKFRLSYILR